MQNQHQPAQHQPVPISIPIIVSDHDRHRYLGDCLRSLPVGAEVVVVETVQSDTATAAPPTLVQSHGDVRYYRWHYREFDFASARNAAKSLCSRPWILSIDADERLMRYQHEEIIHHARHLQHDIVACFVTVAGSMLMGGSAIAERACMHQMRMFRNIAEIKWEGLVHEQVAKSVMALTESGAAKIADTAIMIHHVGYDRDIAEMQKKKERNRALLLKQVALTPDDSYYVNCLINILQQ